MNLYLVAAVLCLAAWAIMVYAMAIPSGWIHLPLAAGCVLLARGIVGKKRS